MKKPKSKYPRKFRFGKVITCEKVKGGFIFEVSPNKFRAGEKRVVTSPVDAITVFVGLIHGEALDEIEAHEEEKNKRNKNRSK